MYCKSLQDVLNLEEVGAKAYNLSSMIRKNIPVPPGFVILNHAFEKNRNISSETNQDLEKEIINFTEKIGAKKYMVRSSAVGEDSDEHSFAGQLESFISEPDPKSLLENIQKCWRSYDKENVKTYQQKSGRKLNGMGVVIQELVEPDFAGVLFTQSFVKEGHMFVEFVEGHGEKLVSGEVNPKSFHCNRQDGKPDAVLPFIFNSIYETAQQLEQHFEQALDIEWVIKDGQSFIVQSRPITTQTKGEKIFWSNTNVNENYPSAITPLLYSIARESYYHYFKNLAKLLQIAPENIIALEPAFSNIIGSWGCRMYYNMSSIHQIISASPFSSLLKKSFDNFVGYQGASKSDETSNTFRGKLKFITEFIRLNISLEKNIKSFENKVDNFSAKTNNSQNLSDLNACFYEFIEIRMHSWYKASLADFFAMVYHGLLGAFCKKYYPENHEGIRNQLIQAIPNIISSKPVIETWKITQLIKANSKAYNLLIHTSPQEFLDKIATQKEFVEINSAINNYLENWGFRCSGELMLTQTNYAEQPEKFIELLKQYIQQSQTNPEELIRKKYKERNQILRNFRSHILKKRHILFPLAIIEIGVLNLLVKLCANGIASRERARLKQALLYFKFKTVIKKIGKSFKRQGILAKADDIFYLNYEEIGENLNASNMLPQQLQNIVKLRKQQFEENAKIEYPDDFYSFFGEYPLPDSLNNDKTVNTGNCEFIKGLSACGGIIKGTAKVLENVMEAHKLQEGDILVTRQTDPGWASVFPLISGLVVERGGMLSHGAIVAREFGIPAIVGVDKATQLIKDGETIILNADKGEIYRNV